MEYQQAGKFGTGGPRRSAHATLCPVAYACVRSWARMCEEPARPMTRPCTSKLAASRAPIAHHANDRDHGALEEVDGLNWHVDVEGELPRLHGDRLERRRERASFECIRLYIGLAGRAQRKRGAAVGATPGQSGAPCAHREPQRRSPDRAARRTRRHPTCRSDLRLPTPASGSASPRIEAARGLVSATPAMAQLERS